MLLVNHVTEERDNFSGFAEVCQAVHVSSRRQHESISPGSTGNWIQRGVKPASIQRSRNNPGWYSTSHNGSSGFSSSSGICERGLSDALCCQLHGLSRGSLEARERRLTASQTVCVHCCICQFCAYATEKKSLK